MAGIDNNTVLYLRGDSFEDLSPSKIDIVNNGVTIINDGNFGKCFNFKNSNTFMYFVSDLFNFGTNDFTIEFFVKLNDTHSYHPLFMSGVSGTQGELAKCSIYENRIDYGGSLGTSGTKPLSSMANYSGKWIHVAMIRKSNNLKFYIDGVSTGEGKTQVYNLNNTRYSIGKDLWYPNNYFNGEMYNIRISNVARHTEDFVPPTQPYTKSDINITKQTDSQISFNITDNIEIKKVEVLVNNIVSKTYTDNYNNLTYNIDSSLCAIGDNKITIRVTYDDNYVEEEILTHTLTVNNLPTTSSLKDVIDRQELLNNSIEVQKNILKNILVGKNVEVSKEDKMGDLIGKVSELGDKKPLIYGIDIDETNSNPSTCVTYTDDAIGFSPLYCGDGTLDYGSWKNTFIIQGNKPCVLKDGVVQYYLNPNDYSKKENGEASDITSGNDGDVMSEFKKCYYKLWKEGNIVKFRVSPVKVDDSWCCNAFLSEDGNGEEKDYMYISTYEAYSLMSKMRSLSGKAPWVSHTIGTARTQATANGVGYQQLTLSKYTFIVMLNVLVTKSLDHQTKIGQGRNKSTNTSAINTGTMNTKGQFWGDQTGTNGMKVFHIENFYGNIWTFMDGLIVSSRVSKYKVNGAYNDSGSGYTSGYSAPSGNGYISKINCSNDNGIIPSASSGSGTTYYTDYVYQNTGTYISAIGSYWNAGLPAGSFCLDMGDTSSHSSSTFGSRLSFS